MTRRIVRTLLQAAAALITTLILVLVLDRNYRVLPNSLHAHMPTHHPGLVVTDVTIAQCSTVNVFSSCNLDKQKWTRVEKDLLLGKSWTRSAYLFVSRKREEDLMEGDSVVMDVTVGRLNPGSASGASEQWESRPSGIWIKRSMSHKASDDNQAITDVDVVFGDDAVEARGHWSIVGVPLLLNTENHFSAHLTIRRGPHIQEKTPKPRFNDNGRFRIMQVADLHLSTGVGKCRDAVPDKYHDGPCEADPRTLEFMAKMLEEEKPDLVILSGDQVNGDTSPDAPSAIYKFAKLLIERSIPYACIFGNHDDEKSMSRAAQMVILESLPYSLSLAGPEDVDGVGNYYIEVLARGKSDHSALSIYMLDTHAYSPDERNFPGYDWIKPSQINWFRHTAEKLKAKHKEYTHRHMDIAFIHIPLHEYIDHTNPRVGAWREGVTAPTYNSGFRDALVEQNVVMVSAGHDHANEYCALSMQDEADKEEQTPALWMCYGGGIGFGGYGGYGGYVRRLRMFEIDANEAKITTWKRIEHGRKVGERHDEQVLVDGGRPVAPQGGT